MSPTALSGSSRSYLTNAYYLGSELNSAIVGGEAGWNRGWRMLAGTARDIEKLEVAAIGLGIAAQAIDDAWAYSRQRRQFGKPICAQSSVRHMLADASTRLEACRMMLYRAARPADQALPCSVASSMAKLFVGEAGLEIVRDCQKILGAYGSARGMDMERYRRDMPLIPIIGGSSAIQRDNIANRRDLPKG